MHKRQGGHMSIGTGSDSGGRQPLHQHELGRRVLSLLAVCSSLRGKQKVRQVPVCRRGHLDFRGESGREDVYHCRLSRKLPVGTLTGAQGSRRGFLASSYGGSLRRSAKASRERDIQIRWLGWGRIVGERCRLEASEWSLLRSGESSWVCEGEMAWLCVGIAGCMKA